MRRVLDICHGCRRCFNLCDSFPILFNEVDQSKTEELDSVPSSSFKKVADACTLCDMCYTAKCPYTPPHEFALDVPHLVLRYRAYEQSQHNLNDAAAEGLEEGPVTQHHKAVPPAQVLPGVSRSLPKNPKSIVHRTYSNQDLMGPVATRLAPLVNRVTQRKRTLARKALQMVTEIDENAKLPAFAPKTFAKLFEELRQPAPTEAKRKVVVYATCFVNHNRPAIGEAAVKMLQASGVHVEVCFPECCGMPELEQGLVGVVSGKAERIAKELDSYIQRGFDVISLTPSCTLMIKQEWPLLRDGDKVVERVADKTFEVSDYLFDMAKENELCEGPKPMEGSVTLHHACHSRAQNIGWKSKDLLRMIPGLKVLPSERCSGHGGTWGFEQGNYDTALKVGAPVIKKALADAEKAKNGVHYVTSDCPMAADHLLDGMEIKKGSVASGSSRLHPLEIVAKSFL